MTADASGVLRALELPGDRPLERPELERLAGALAARGDIWRPHLDLSANERTYACLHRDAQLDVWAIFWLPENDTGWHDHDTSSGAVHVVDGALEEHALRVAAPDRRTRYDRRPGLHVRALAHPSRDLRVAARGVDPHLLAPALAARAVHASTRRARCTGCRSPTPTSCARSTLRPPAA